ncbi:MAG: hypothetical protein GY832_17020 [Chloroflexi bacterium]|nr:hypothetical protein [Chloroflexota bacterium]
MKIDEFLSVPENRAFARTVSLQAAGTLAPSEARMNKRFVEPLLDRVAKDQTMSPEAANAAMGLGGGELALIAIVPIVTQVLFQFLQKLGKNNLAAVTSRLKGEPHSALPIAQVAVSSDKGASEWKSRAKLRQTLAKGFNDTELRDLCFDLNIDDENLFGENAVDIAREIAAYAMRHGRLDELFAIVKELRPHVSWQDDVDPTGGAPTAFPGVPTEGVLVVYMPLAQNRKALQELTRAVNIALQEHMVSQYGK